MLEKEYIRIQGIKIGHQQNKEAATGCTVVLCETGATAGVDVRGGAPGTRETDLLNPMNLVDKVHGILLAGGSAFGLDAAAGVMAYLEEKNIGFDVGVTKVPIVTGAVLFDLALGSYDIRPDKKMGYEACLNADNDKWLEGSVGAGTGAMIGKIMGMETAMKGGLGSFYIQTGDLIVGAIVAVNSFGDIIDPDEGCIIGGALKKDSLSFLDTERMMIENYKSYQATFNGNTTIGVIVTNGKLTKAQANKIASMAHDGYARTMRPAHTMVDGDTIFSLATGEISADVNVIGLLAAKTMEKAVIRAIKKAKSLHNIKAYQDLKNYI